MQKKDLLFDGHPRVRYLIGNEESWMSVTGMPSGSRRHPTSDARLRPCGCIRQSLHSLHAMRARKKETVDRTDYYSLQRTTLFSLSRFAVTVCACILSAVKQAAYCCAVRTSSSAMPAVRLSFVSSMALTSDSPSSRPLDRFVAGGDGFVCDVEPSLDREYQGANLKLAPR
jgi:hypothetical protein